MTRTLYPSSICTAKPASDLHVFSTRLYPDMFSCIPVFSDHASLQWTLNNTFYTEYLEARERDAATTVLFVVELRHRSNIRARDLKFGIRRASPLNLVPPSLDLLYMKIAAKGWATLM